MNLVRLSDYQKPQLEVVEHRVADTDDGFMRVANELTDSLLQADLTARQLKVMLAIMRKTYGFNKAMDRLTNTQIAAMTGIHHTHVCAAKRQLIERNFLVSDGMRIGVNKVVSQWISQVSKELAKPANETLAKLANTHKPTQLNTKDNIQKTINTNTQTHEVGLSDGEKLTPRQKGTNPRAKGTNPRSAMPTFDRDRLKNTWNCKAETHGIPKIRSITTTIENGLKRLWSSYLKQCRELGRDPRDIDTVLNGYFEHGYKPTEWAKGVNPDGKKYGIETALRQEKIDQILGEAT